MAGTKPDDFEAVRMVVAALEGFDAKDQERILRWAREKVGLRVPSHSEEAAAATIISEARAASGVPPDIRSFVDLKKPRSDIQFAATVAYYYRFDAPESQRKASITAADLQDATRKTGRDRLKRPDQTLVNAHTQGYLDRAEKGAYAINTVGENLVAMALPEQGRPRRATITSRKASGRRKAKRATNQSKGAARPKKRTR